MFDAVDVCRSASNSQQLFALLLGALSVRYVHRDAKVLADFLRGIVMPDATRRNLIVAIGATSSEFDVDNPPLR